MADDDCRPALARMLAGGGQVAEPFGKLFARIVAADGLAGLDGAATKVYAALVSCSDGLTGKAHPGHGWLIDHLHLAEETISRSINRLKKRGLIVVVRESAGRRVAAEYLIVSDPEKLQGVPPRPAGLRKMDRGNPDQLVGIKEDGNPDQLVTQSRPTGHPIPTSWSGLQRVFRRDRKRPPPERGTAARPMMVVVVGVIV